jgi:transposase InsO family protein
MEVDICILTLVDDYTHFLVTYAIKNKSEVVNSIKQYEAAATARFSVKICKFRCDNGAEYVTNELKEFFAEKGIQFEYTIPYSPALNGQADQFQLLLGRLARETPAGRVESLQCCPLGGSVAVIHASMLEAYICR